MTIKQTVLTIAIPLAMFSSTVLSQSDAASILEALDADGNGSLSQSEASANEMLVSRWDDLDADGNGEVTAAELAALIE